MTQVPVDDIISYNNVRFNVYADDLKASMDRVGLIQPVVLLEQEDGKHVLLAGHRRLEAARQLGWSTIPAVFNDTAESPADVIVTQIHENLRREDLSAFELAQGTLDLKSAGLTQKAIADDLGMSQKEVSQLQHVARRFSKVDDDTRTNLTTFTTKSLFDLEDRLADKSTPNWNVDDYEIIVATVVDGGWVHSAVWGQRQERERHDQRAKLQPILDALLTEGGSYIPEGEPAPATTALLATYTPDGDVSKDMADMELTPAQLRRHRKLNTCTVYQIVNSYSGLTIHEMCDKPKSHASDGDSEFTEPNAEERAAAAVALKEEKAAERAATKARKERARELLESKTWPRAKLIDEVLPLVTQVYADDWRAVCGVLGLEPAEGPDYDKYRNATQAWIEELPKTKQPLALVMVRAVSFYTQTRPNSWQSEQAAERTATLSALFGEDEQSGEE